VTVAEVDGQEEARDATRGGVNAPACRRSRQSAGNRPLSIDVRRHHPWPRGKNLPDPVDPPRAVGRTSGTQPGEGHMARRLEVSPELPIHMLLSNVRIAAPAPRTRTARR
jgi:hypothetical protein